MGHEASSRNLGKGSCACGAVLMSASAEAVPIVERTDPRCARLTWVSFHSAGFLFLWLSGNWPTWPEGWPFFVLLGLTTVFYVVAGLMDPGYLPREDDFVPITPQTGLGAAASPLLDLPKCEHCTSRQIARAKVRAAAGRCLSSSSLRARACRAPTDGRVRVCVCVCVYARSIATTAGAACAGWTTTAGG